MALEFDMQSDADISTADFRSFLAAAVEGEHSQDGTIFRPDMYVMAGRVTPDTEDPTTELFGFRERISATYRFANLAEASARDHNIAVMVSSILAFAERYTSRGVLLYNGDIAVIQWAPDEVVFHSEWEDWSELEEVIPLIAGHVMRPLPQPLISRSTDARDSG
ncbi:SitI3 family protein [Actinoplanes sp. GCM10030250]|uniref:SitI3 family protein n=1 Tax=Actinoplanes sp. GCM10030250 TaxID=3273376 RepID=UPI00361B8DEC